MNGFEAPKNLSKQKGFKRIVIGLVLVVLQIVAVAGKLNTGGLFHYSIPYLCGFFVMGVVGIALIIAGVVANKNSTK